MIKSAATTSIPELPRKGLQPASFGWGRLFFTLTFRLLLLGAGGSLAAVVGIAVAQLYPAQTEEPPSLERLVQQTQLLLKNVGQDLTGWGSAENSLTEDSQPGNRQTQTSQTQPAIADAVMPSPMLAGSTSTAEWQQLQMELTQLQAELQTLTNQSTEPLENQVQEIQKRIQAIQERLSSLSTDATTAPPAILSTSNQDHLMVTLPSDALFADPTTSNPDEAILDSILSDLRRYPEASIQVSAHTDRQDAGTNAQHRSLEQAKAVQQYLSTQLDSNVHWVTIGYGDSRPLVASDSSENQQRNRRIEILIKP